MRALISVLALFALPALAQNRPLNDTGIDFCGGASIGNNKPCLGTEPPGQDFHYGRDKDAGGKGFSFTALNASGQPTTPSSGATPHPCVRDNVTGLVWEVKTDDGGLHDKDWTYTWYKTNSPDGNNGTPSGGSCGGMVAAGCDTEKFVAAVNTAGRCGFNDWRMPTVKELAGIADLGRVNPAIDQVFFPNTPNANFWSGSNFYYPAEFNAWTVYFNTGQTIFSPRSSSGHVRLVRGGI